MKSILFVCLGNICRSPAAEGIFRHLVEQESMMEAFHIESCGLGDWHIGHLPDERMREAAKSRGYLLSSRAQKMDPTFFERFDLILVADHKVMKQMYHLTNEPAHKAKIQLITHFSTTYRDLEVPDPYFNGEAGFEHVMDMLEDSCQGLLTYLRKELT